MMGDLSKNLSRREMACACKCGFDTVDIKLVEVLQAATNFFSKKYGDCRLDITGGNRCKRHNDALREKGIPTAVDSEHIYGRAADFKLTVRSDAVHVPPQETYEWLDEMYGDKIALGLYVNRVHVGTRTHAGQRWGNT